MIELDHWDKQLPDGVADLFFEEAAQQRWLDERLRQTFARWGYTEIIPPTFEYYESLATEAGAQLLEEMYRFFDREGRTLALRADLTIPTARVVGTKLYDQPLPLRFYYAGNVFRYEDPKAGSRREFHQTGIELVGAGSAESDAEVIALLIMALKQAGLEHLHVDLGQVAFFKSLLRRSGLGQDDAALLIRAIDSKDVFLLRQVLERCSLTDELRAAFAALPRLQGGAEVLEEAEALDLDEASRMALATLRQTYAELQALHLADYTRLDLGQVKGMEYYTGLTMQVFAPGVGFPIAGGGRYDHLVGHFGPEMPAVGFAIGLERLVVALRAQGDLTTDIWPQVLLDGGVWSRATQVAMGLRALGLRVEVDVAGRDEAALEEYAAQRGVPHVIFGRDGGWMVAGGDQVLDDAVLMEVAGTWID